MPSPTASAGPHRLSSLSNGRANRALACVRLMQAGSRRRVNVLARRVGAARVPQSHRGAVRYVAVVAAVAFVSVGLQATSVALADVPDLSGTWTLTDTWLQGTGPSTDSVTLTRTGPGVYTIAHGSYVTTDVPISGGSGLNWSVRARDLSLNSHRTHGGWSDSGHLGRGNAWVISWLPQATERGRSLSPGRGTHCPGQPQHRSVHADRFRGVRKTRLVASGLERAGLVTTIIERRMGPGVRVTLDEHHVALLGVDNFPTRRLISAISWPFAIDVGLGSGPGNFGSLLMRRFPGAVPSDQIVGWQDESEMVIIPDSPAFDDLKRRQDQCGLVELAGKAVGASFVGVVAACVALAEATRELHGGKGFDVLALDTTSVQIATDPATTPAEVVALPLHDSTVGRSSL